MRLAGFDEELITGSADPWDKFTAWAATVPRLIRNPLYIWTHLELRRVFGIDLILNPGTAREIWEEANRQLPSWPTQKLLQHFGVRVIATTEDPPTTSLPTSPSARNADASVAMIPTFRPDAAHRLLDDPSCVERVGRSTRAGFGDTRWTISIRCSPRSRDAYRAIRRAGRPSERQWPQPATRRRPRSIPRGFRHSPRPARQAGERRRARRGHARGPRRLSADSPTPTNPCCSCISGRFATSHRGCSVRSVMTWAPTQRAIEPQAQGLARFLGDLERDGSLPRVRAVQRQPGGQRLSQPSPARSPGPGSRHSSQWGPPWWFNDHERGIRRQLDVLSEVGQLAGFMGMLTDSRSVLSMTRHELFRRILCDVIGRDVEEGRIPADIALVLESGARRLRRQRGAVLRSPELVGHYELHVADRPDGRRGFGEVDDRLRRWQRAMACAFSKATPSIPRPTSRRWLRVLPSPTRTDGPGLRRFARRCEARTRSSSRARH